MGAATYLFWIALGVTAVGVFVLTDRWLDIRKHEREDREFVEMWDSLHEPPNSPWNNGRSM